MPRLARSLLSLLLLGTLAPLAGAPGCKGFETNLQDTEVDYEPTARRNFEAGEAAMEEEHFNEAIRYFEYVKNKFPYSRFAVLSDLRVADCYYAREEWLDAADAYRLFSRFHPRHEQVPYATFRIAMAYWNATQSDLERAPVIGPLMPYLSPFAPARERDQTATQDAIRAFDEYLTRFPEDENAEEARALRIEARTKLAEHDVYAADFYAGRGKWRGAMWRHERIATAYADTPLAARSLEEAARIAEDELDEPAHARDLLLRLAEQQEGAKKEATLRAVERLDQEVTRRAEKKAKKEAERAAREAAEADKKAAEEAEKAEAEKAEAEKAEAEKAEPGAGGPAGDPPPAMSTEDSQSPTPGAPADPADPSDNETPGAPTP